MANSARVKSRQGKKAANNRRQTLGLPRFDQTQFGKSSGLGELSAFGSCLEKGLEVGLVGAFKAPSEATAERLDEIAELGRLRCSSQETKHLALIVSERTCLGKPIQALLKRRGLWRGLPGRSDRVGAPCPPRGRGYRRCNRPPSARRDDCGCKLSQPQWAGIAFDPADNIRICPWRSGQAARSQCVGQVTAKCPSFVGVHGVSFRSRDGRAKPDAPSQQADQSPLAAGVAIDVALSRLDGSVPGQQLDVAQAAAAAVGVARRGPVWWGVARRGGKKGSPAGVRRASLEAELSEQRRKPIHHACRAQTAATGGADDRPGRFAYPQEA